MHCTVQSLKYLMWSESYWQVQMDVAIGHMLSLIPECVVLQQHMILGLCTLQVLLSAASTFSYMWLVNLSSIPDVGVDVLQQMLHAIYPCTCNNACCILFLNFVFIRFIWENSLSTAELLNSHASIDKTKSLSSLEVNFTRGILGIFLPFFIVLLSILCPWLRKNITTQK